METIFDHQPTENELVEITSDGAITQEQYLKQVDKKAFALNTTKEYEIVVDLQELFSLRGDKEKMKHYTDVLLKDFADIKEAHFNE